VWVLEFGIEELGFGIEFDIEFEISIAHDCIKKQNDYSHHPQNNVCHPERISFLK